MTQNIADSKNPDFNHTELQLVPLSFKEAVNHMMYKSSSKVTTHFESFLTWNSPFLQQPFKLLLGQLHQAVHLVFSALEVLDAEGVHGHLLDVELFTPA